MKSTETKKLTKITATKLHHMRHLMIIFLLFISLSSIATPKKSHIHISGKIIGNEDNKVNKIIVKIYDSYWIVGDLGAIIKSTDIQPNGSFNLDFEAIQATHSLVFSLCKDNRLVETTTYYAEQGDEITIEVTLNFENNGDPQKIFRGKGADKYNLVEALNREDFEAQHKKQWVAKGFKFKGSTDSVKLYQDLKNYGQMLKDLMISRTKFIKGYQGEVNTEIRNWIDVDHPIFKISWAARCLEAFEEAGNSSAKNAAKKIFNEFKSEFEVKANTSNLGASLLPFLIIRQNGYDLNINDNEPNFALEQLFNRIKNNYSGPIREYTLARLFLDRGSMLYTKQISDVKYDSLLMATDSLLTISFLKAQLETKLRLAKGKKLMYASFVDPEGQNVTIEQFKGKVVFIEMWGTGCAPCALFHQYFEKNIAPEFEGNQDLIRLSINIDKSKERWLNSINSGKYTSMKEKNVFTGGLGGAHPFKEYNNIHFIPFLLIIDKDGRVYSLIKGNEGAKGIISLIQNALDTPPITLNK